MQDTPDISGQNVLYNEFAFHRERLKICEKTDTLQCWGSKLGYELKNGIRCPKTIDIQTQAMALRKFRA